MSDDQLNAISGKLDRVLTRQAESEERDHDILAKLTHLEELINLPSRPTSNSSTDGSDFGG